MSDFLSVSDPQKNMGKNSDSIFKEELSIFLCLIPLAIIYLATYFNKSIVTDSDGETFKEIFYGLWLIGSLIGYNVIKLFQRFYDRQLYVEQESFDSDDEDIGIESGIMETYQYSSARDLKWGNWLIAGAFGGLNVVIYIIFLTFIN